MARYRHYQNRGVGGDTVYFTTTCLDFAHLFRRGEVRSHVAKRLAFHHLQYGVVLHSYVVMVNHMHFISRLPQNATASWFVQRVKTNTTIETLPLLTRDELQLIDHQRGLDSRLMWKRSYRSLVVDKAVTLAQKMEYVHLNPVRAGIAAKAEDYPCSSAFLFNQGLWTEEAGIAEHVLRTGG